MKRIFSTLAILLYSVLVFSQSGPVTLNFVRPKNSTGSFSTIKILINNQHIGDIDNGKTFTYKMVFSGKGNIEVLVNYSIYSRTISLEVESGGTYNFETGFADMATYILAIDSDTFEKHKQMLLAQEQQEQQQQSTTQSASGGSETTQTGGGTTSQFKVDRNDLSVTYQAEKELDSEAIRQEWLKKGGSLTNSSFVAGLSVLSKDDESIMLTGVGLNMAFNQNLFRLKIPEYTEGLSSWASFHFGYGISGAFNSTTIEFWDYDIDPVTSTNINLNLNLNAGLTLGLGRFIDRANWRGTAVELNYRPSYVTFIPEEGDPTSDFNFSGFSFDFNGSNFTSTMNKIAPKAQLKMSFFVLPPINDMPLFISINIGAVWYNK